jgi:hypothetical protein
MSCRQLMSFVAIAFAAAIFSGAGVWSLPAFAQGPPGVTIYSNSAGGTGPGAFQPASPTNPVPTYPVSGPTGSGITPVVSAALEGSHVLDAFPGSLYAAYATNLTGGTTGYLMIFNATSAPADGAVTPLVCTPFDSSGRAQAFYSPGPPAIFSAGITAVASSGANCFTKTTGVLTAFFSGMSK